MPLISEIIDVGGISKDIDVVIDKIVDLEGEITKANATPLSVKVDLAGAEGLTQLNAGMREMRSSLEQLNGVQQQNAQITQQANSIQTQYGKSIVEGAEALAEQRIMLDATNKQIKFYNEAITKGTGDMEKNYAIVGELTKQQQELKIEIGATTSAIKSQIKEVNAAGGSMDAMSQSLFQMKEQYRALSTAERENSEVGGKLLLDIKLLDAQLKLLDGTIGNNQRKVGDYSGALEAAGLTAENLRVKMAQLTAAGQQETAEFKQLESQSIQVKLAMNQMASSLTTVTGGSTTTSASLGILKTKMQEMVVAGKQDSAEFREMQIEAQRLAAAMREVSASTGRAIFSIENAARRVETMFFRMALHFVIITALIGTISALVEWFTKLSDAEQEATDRLEDYTSSVKNLHKAQGDLKSDVLATVFFDESKIRSQMSILKDQNLTLDQRFRAYKALQSIAPGVLDDMDKEGFKTSENTKRMDTQLASMQKYIELQTRITKERELQKITIESQQKNEDTQEELRARLNSYYDGASPGFVDNIVSKSGSSHGIIEAQHTKDAVDLNKAMKDRLAIDKDILEANTRLADLDKQMAALQGDTKDKKEHEKKANAKGLDAELLEEKKRFEAARLALKKEYDEKDNTIDDVRLLHQKELADNEFTIAAIFGERMRAINEKWHGKVGEDEHKYNARLLEAAVERVSIQNKDTEEIKKATAEQQEIEDKRLKKEDEAAEHLREHFARMKQLEADAEELKSNRDASHKYAGGFSPLLSAFGFDGEFGESQKGFDRQIAAREAEKTALGANRDTELHRVRNGGMPDPEKLAKFDEDIQAKKNEIDDLNAQKEKERDDKIIEAKKRISEETIQLAKETAESIKTIRDNQFAAQQQQLEIQMNAVKLQSEQQMQAIDATTNFAIVKDNQKAKLAAQTAAKENEIQQKQNELALKKAIADKKSAEASILMSTAMAIMRVIASASELGPAGFAIGVAESAVVAAIGAAQYAAAASTPIPQYEKGTGPGGTTSPFFIAAEGNKSEMMVTPQGKLIMANKEGVYHAPIGTEVINNAETNKMLRHMAWSNFGLPQAEQSKGFNDKNIVEELQETRDTMLQIGLMQARNQTRVIVVNQHNFYQRNKK